MIYGVKNWNDKSIRYDQTKRVMEKFLEELKKNKQVDFWLETCNVCASCCAIESVGGEFLFPLPRIANKSIISYADLLFDYIYTLDTYKVDGICDNELMENLMKGINAISTCKSEMIVNRNNKKLVESMIENLKNKNAIVLSYTTDYKSGHYVCLTAYDTDKNIFIGYDSWGNNKHCKNNGILEEYSFKFLEERIRNYCYLKVANTNG